MVNVKSLIDAYRHFHPNKKEYTFFRTSCAPSRLDRFYVSQEILPKVNSVQHVASLSDHCGVLIDVRQCVCFTLQQALFAMMQFTKRKFVDPANFICKLGLNPSVQQDAQEFSKIFVSLLEDSLAHQKQVSVRTMIQKQFRGEYAYVTTCQTCLKESVRPSHFYELDLALAGNKTIDDCLGDFLKVETMTGDEKYYCENCCSKQDATRCCVIAI